MWKVFALCVALVVAQPPGGGPPGGGGGGGGTVGGCDDCDTASCSSSDYSDDIRCTSWIINSEGTMSAIFSSVEVNVQSVQVATSSSGIDYAVVKATGIPDYTFTMDQDTLDWLNARPNADTDFTGGATTATLGTTYDFGDDIGYDSSSCTKGWWPPGPVCPDDAAKELYFPMNPTPAADGENCATTRGQIGTLLNGVSVYDWSDAMSYNSEGVWENLAIKFEKYDLDICSGHAANGDYHHHNIPNCFAAEIGDDGGAHSPLYGFAADGYPIYGVHHANGVRSQSCWKTRDYSASSSTGCGTAGARTCVLKDQYDASKGTTEAAYDGPTTSTTVSSQSGNDFVATSGFYFQDYYYDSDCTESGDQYLDEHNGHSHGKYGYHYHFTDTFPYVPGPTFYGALHDTGFVQCDTYYSDGSGDDGDDSGDGDAANISSLSLVLVFAVALLTLAPAAL